MTDLRTTAAYARRDLPEQAAPLRAQVGVRVDLATQRRLREALAIAETIAQPWPRCGGERIDGAEVWARQWTDAEVIAWLEVGVYTAAAAIRLARAGIEPREVDGPAPPRPARDCDCHLMPRRGQEYGAGGNSGDLPAADCPKCEGLGVVPGAAETDVTLGLTFARGDVSVDRVLELRRPAREVSRG